MTDKKHFTTPFEGSWQCEATPRCAAHEPPTTICALEPGDVFHYPHKGVYGHHLFMVTSKFDWKPGYIACVQPGNETGVQFWFHPLDLEGITPLCNRYKDREKPVDIVIEIG